MSADERICFHRLQGIGPWLGIIDRTSGVWSLYDSRSWQPNSPGRVSTFGDIGREMVCKTAHTVPSLGDPSGATRITVGIKAVILGEGFSAPLMTQRWFRVWETQMHIPECRGAEGEFLG